MTQAQAKLTNFRATPRKMRLLADFVRGKTVKKALAELKFVNKRHAEAMAKLIASARANAKNNVGLGDNLVISEATVQEGQRMKRHRAGSMGRANPFKKRLSHVSISVAEAAALKTETKKAATNKKDNK